MGSNRHACPTTHQRSPHEPAPSGARPRSVPARVALSTVSVYPRVPAAAFEIASRLGYDGLEVMVMGDNVSQDADALNASWTPTRSRSSRCTRPACWSPSGCGATTLGRLVRAKEAAEELGADTVVVHPPFRWQRDYARDFVRGLHRMGDETDVRFAVENMYPWRARSRELAAYSPGWDVREEDYPHTTLDLSPPP